MYDTALEASLDTVLDDKWARASGLIARLIAEAGPGALEGDGRDEFIGRAFAVLRPVTEDTLTRSRIHATRQLRAMGTAAVPADIAGLSLTERDVRNLMNSAVRAFFSTGARKDFDADPAAKRDAFTYAADLVGRGVITMLNDKRLTATTATYEAAGITLYERYLGSGDHCDRCKEVAGAVVTRKDVKPIHAKCNCGVRPRAPRR